MFTFSDKIDEINTLLRLNRGAWKLSYVPGMDYKDVEQIIRIHLNKKWNQWDQNLPLAPWVNRIISNQIKNLIRNHYGKYVSPCVGCKFDRGESFCAFSISGKKDDECPQFEKWKLKKQHRYFIHFMPSIDKEGFLDVHEPKNSGLDISPETTVERFHKHMLSSLSSDYSEFYNLIYIKHLSDEEIILEKKKNKGFSKKTFLELKENLEILVRYEIKNFDPWEHAN